MNSIFQNTVSTEPGPLLISLTVRVPFSPAEERRDTSSGRKDVENGQYLAIFRAWRGGEWRWFLLGGPVLLPSRSGKVGGLPLRWMKLMGCGYYEYGETV